MGNRLTQVNKNGALLSRFYYDGTIAHESMHYEAGPGSLLQEYKAYLVGEAVKYDLIQRGYGNKSDINVPLNNFTVDISNPDKAQLANSLKSWFLDSNNGVHVYADPKDQHGYELPALPPHSQWWEFWK